MPNPPTHLPPHTTHSFSLSLFKFQQKEHTHPGVNLAQVVIPLKSPAEKRLVIQIHFWDTIFFVGDTVNSWCLGKICTRCCLGDKLHHVTMWNVPKTYKNKNKNLLKAHYFEKWEKVKN